MVRPGVVCCATCLHAKVTTGEKVYCVKGEWDKYRKLQHINKSIRECAAYEPAEDE